MTFHRLFALALLSVIGPGFVEAAPKIAVFPIEVGDFIAEGEFIPKPAKEGPRAALATDELRRLLGAGDAFEIIDLKAFEADIKAAAPLHKCNGCETDLGKKVGADVIVTGLAEKASDTLFNIGVVMKDVSSGKVLRLGSTVIQGNTDDMWLRAVRWLHKNRLTNMEPGR